MVTYIVIGLITSLIIRIERFILRSEIQNTDWRNWFVWVILLLGFMIDVILWPISVITEIILIIYRR